MNELRRGMLLPYVTRLNNAVHGEKTAIFDECANAFGWSRQKAIRVLKDVGWEPPRRKTRSDKGKTAVSKDTLLRVAAVQRAVSTKTGKDTLHVTGAYAIVKTADDTGLPVSVSRTRQLLRNHQLDRKTFTRPAPHVHMRSLHPNHVHQVDPSLSRLYYAPKGLALITDAEANRNKVDGYKRLKLWRYVLTDHYSGYSVIRYYETAGETQANLYDFLLYAWGKKGNQLYPFHGVPDILMCDSGSANISRAMTYALNALDVKTLVHGVGKPQVKGQVEVHNDIAESFEARLRLQPQMTVEDINAAAEQWCAAYNANKIPNYDSRLNRNNCVIVRLNSWLTIKQDQLRELPDTQLCRDLLTRDPKRAVVRGDLFLPHDGRVYSLAGLPGIYAGMEVFVQPLLMRDDKILRVHYTNDQHEDISIEVAPLAVDEHSGFFADSPVIGQEYKTHVKTAPERNAETLDEIIADPVLPFNGEIKAISQLDIKPDVHYMPHTGIPIDISGGSVFDNTLTPVQAANRLKNALGFWTAACMEYVRNNYPSGVKESDLSRIKQYLQGANDGISTQTSVA